MVYDLRIFLPTHTLWRDKIGATYLTTNLAFHARTKHIEIDFYFVRNKVVFKTLVVCWLSSKDTLDDIFTKPIASAPFFFHADQAQRRVPHACEG